MAEPACEIAISFADRDAGVGNLDLDLATPVAGVSAGRAAGIGLCLQLRQPVEKLVCDDVAAHSALRNVRGHTESIDHDAVVMGRGPDRRGDHDDERERYQRGRHFEHHLHHVADVVHAQRPVPQSVLALEIGDLQIGKAALFAQVFARFGAGLAAERDLGGERIAAGRGAVFEIFSHQSLSKKNPPRPHEVGEREGVRGCRHLRRWRGPLTLPSPP